MKRITFNKDSLSIIQGKGMVISIFNVRTLKILEEYISVECEVENEEIKRYRFLRYGNLEVYKNGERIDL